MLPQTSATIPYHPGLMLGNVVEDCDMLSKLEDLANAQKEVDNSQYRLDKSLLSKYRLEMILADLRSLLPDENMLKIQHQIDAINEDITSIAIALANASVNESEIDRGDGNVEHAHQKVESPIDFDQSAIRQNLLASDSMNMNCQYIRNDTSSLDSNHSHHPSSVANEVSFSVSSILSPKYASRMSAKAKAATWQQINLHKIEGTIVITVNCVHKMADTIFPFVLDIEKAIVAWNTVNEDDKLKIDEINEDNHETGPSSSASTQQQQQETYMKVITGQILGSSFVGLIHVLRKESVNSAAKSSNVDRNLDLPFGDVNLSSENESNYFASKNSGVRFDYGTSFAKKLDSCFSTAENLQSHCSIITLGFGGANDTAAHQNEVFDENTSQSFSNGGKDVQEGVAMPFSPLSSLEKEVLPLVRVSPEGDKKPSLVDIKYKNMVQRDYLMATLDDFIVKAGQGCGGVPIQFFLQPISKQMLIKEYLKAKRENDDSSFQPARHKRNKRNNKWRIRR